MAGDESGYVQSDEWIGLADALALVLRAVEAELQVQNGRGWLSESAHGAARIPSPDELGQLLRRRTGVTVYPPPLSDMKARSLEQKLQMLAGTFKREHRDRSPLRLTDTALVDAHMWLMTLFRCARVRTRAIDCSAPLFPLLHQDAAAAVRPTEMSPDQWSLRQGEDRRERGRANASPVPDYRDNWLTPVIDIHRRTQTEFRSIEVSKADLLAEILTTPTAHAVAGGIFRAVSTEQGRRLEIECLGQRAILEPTVGLGAIGVLLSRPDVAITWEYLDGAARAFSEGEEAERAVLEGEAALSGVSDGDVREPDPDEQLTTVTVGAFDLTVRRDWEEIARVKRELNQKRDSLARAAPKSRIRREKEIAETEVFLKQMENDLKRWERPTDKFRQATYHALENALSRLAAVCMPLAVHLGTLHEDQRTRFHIENGAIAYRPRTSVVWETTPKTPRERGSLSFKG